MRMLLIVVVLILVGCSTTPAAKNPPAPAIINVPVATYVPINPTLTKRCNWVRIGKPSQVFYVSNGRKKCLLQYEEQLDAIDNVQGKPVPDKSP